MTLAKPMASLSRLLGMSAVPATVLVVPQQEESSPSLLPALVTQQILLTLPLQFHSVRLILRREL
jgi:hypothetical protein